MELVKCPHLIDNWSEKKLNKKQGMPRIPRDKCKRIKGTVQVCEGQKNCDYFIDLKKR